MAFRLAIESVSTKELRTGYAIWLSREKKPLLLLDIKLFDKSKMDNYLFYSMFDKTLFYIILIRVNIRFNLTFSQQTIQI